MFYRVLLDCIAPPPSRPAGFFTTRFVEADGEREAIDRAIAAAKNRMLEQHYSDETIAAHRFEVDLVELCEASDIDRLLERGFTFYEEE